LIPRRQQWVEINTIYFREFAKSRKKSASDFESGRISQIRTSQAEAVTRVLHLEVNMEGKHKS
jgi:hypothetical protein